MHPNDDNITELLARATCGSSGATQQLMQLHRPRLRRMVAARLDRRLRSRLDPSDVVQDVLLEATGRLGDYSKQPKLPFYVWLRQIAWDRLLELYRQHVHVEKRSVIREVSYELPVSDDSVNMLAAKILSRASSPSECLIRKETRRRTREAMALLPEVDRELLIMRYVEQMKLREIAAELSCFGPAITNKTRAPIGAKATGMVTAVSIPATWSRHFKMEDLNRVLASAR